MRICHITTFWPNHLGHTHYTDALIKGIQKTQPDKHYIAAEIPADQVDTHEYQCLPCFRRDEDYVPGIVEGVKSMQADIALIQYSNDLFGDDNRLPMLLQRLKAAGIPTVVLNHSVYPVKWKTKYQPGQDAAHFDRAVAEFASCMLVHTNRMKQDLLDRGVDANKIVVIPHGTIAMPQRDPAASRRALDLPINSKVVLFFGFIWLGKGLDFLLSAFAKTAKELPDAHLYIGGYTRHKLFYTKMYMKYLRARIKALGIAERTRLWGDYVPDELVPTIFSAADLVAFPYRQDYSSVSGVAHQTAGLGKPMLCSRIAKFEEIGESISPQLLLDPKDKRAWAEAMTRLLTDKDWADEIRTKTRRFAANTSWEVLGKQHLALYKVLIEGKPAANVSFASAA